MSVLTNRHFGHTEGQTRQVSQRAMSSGRGRGKGALRGDGGAGGGTAQQLRRSIATGGVPGSAPRSNAAENRAPARAPTHGRLPDMADEDEPARSDQEHGAGRPRAKRETNASKLARSVHEADDRAHERYMQAMDALQPVVTDRKAPGYRASMQHLARQLAEEFVWSNNMYRARPRGLMLCCTQAPQKLACGAQQTPRPLCSGCSRVFFLTPLPPSLPPSLSLAVT